MSAKSGIAVIGVGNLLMRDEGVGVHVIRYLQEHYRFTPSVELIDGGTTGSDLIPYFERNDRILIVDAVDFHQPPGYIGRIKNHEILRHFATKLSLHNLGLSDVLSQMKLLGIEPREIMLLGIQPKVIAVGTELSEVLQEKLPRLVELVLQQLKEWGVTWE